MLALPPYIDAELWADFVDGRTEMQKKARIPFTDVAKKRILMKLMKMRSDGIDANQALEEAICNSWRSVFPPKGGTMVRGGQQTGETAYQRSVRENVEAWAPAAAKKAPGTSNIFDLGASDVTEIGTH